MVGIVREAQGVASADKGDYALEAEALKHELQKSRRNPSRVREMLATLSDTAGALGLVHTLSPYAEQMRNALDPWLR